MSTLQLHWNFIEIPAETCEPSLPVMKILQQIPLAYEFCTTTTPRPVLGRKPGM